MHPTQNDPGYADQADGEPTDDNGDELVAEDWPTYYTAVPVWLLLSGCSAQAYRMYAFLAEHINQRQPGRRISCPKQTAIAKVLSLKNSRQVGKYATELEAVGAIRIQEYRYANGMRRGYRYHVRFNPPAGYSGSLSLGQFYEANPDVRSAPQPGRTAAAKGETAGRAGGTKKSTSGGAKNSTVRGTPHGTVRGTPGSTAELNQVDPDEDLSLRPAVPEPRAATAAPAGERETTATPDKTTTSARPEQPDTTASNGPAQVLAAYEQALGAPALNGTRTKLLTQAAELLTTRPLWWVTDRARELPRYGIDLAKHAAMSKVPVTKPKATARPTGLPPENPDYVPVKRDMTALFAALRQPK